jgi:hypothetical protein
VTNNVFSQVKIYPNPARHEVTISYSGNSSKINVSIISIDGKVVSDHEISDIDNSIDLSNLKNGFYFIQIKYANGELHFAKLIKE